MSDAVVATPLNFHAEFQALVANLPRWPEEVASAFVHAFSATPGEIVGHWTIVLVLMVVAGYAVEHLGCWKLNRMTAAFSRERTDSITAISAYALMNVIFDLVGVALFAAAAYITRHVLVDADSAIFATLGGLLVAFLKVRCVVVIARAIFAPHAEGIRLLPLDNADARVFTNWLIAFSACYAGAYFIIETLYSSGVTPLYARATIPFVGGFVTAVFALFLFANRARLGRQFGGDVQATGASTRTQVHAAAIRHTLSQIWPLLVAMWLMVLWVNWSHSIFTADRAREASIEIAWWVTLLFPLADRMFNALLKAILSLPVVVNSPFASRRERFLSVLQTGFRLLLVAVGLFAMAVAWQLAGTTMFESGIGRKALSAFIDIGVTLLLAYIVWEIVISILDHYMPKANADAGGSPDGEGGGAGATRAETLAPLLRGGFIVLLIIVVLLTVLSSLGVEVTPLLAGAGVMGIAVGFGAQKLVQDVISGLFFLLDDAFRRGEFIDVGSVKGTVERISIRSMQLRHHMGNLHTIPFGEIRYLTNFSRDWVMMKLKLRLVYGTDPERVRKIVKKLGQELLEHPEVGPMFMEPLKSQGVFSMEDDSAMIFRVKFMTKPGDQFVVRKAVYNAINTKFVEEGIEFAHRVVTVRVEEDGDPTLDRESKERIAAAALPNTAGAAPAGADSR